MGKTISLVNPKGGICKSTLALCLAATFDNSLIVDLDPQACLWAWYSDRLFYMNEKEGFTDKLAVQHQSIEPSTFEQIEDLSQQYEHIFIDCPGESNAGETTRSALVYSDLIIIPVQNSEFDVLSLLNNLEPFLEEAKKANEKNGRIVFLPVFVHPLANNEKAVERFRGLNVEVLNAVFRFRPVMKIFSECGRTLNEFVQHGKYAKDRVQAIDALANVDQIAEQIKTYL